MTPRQDLGLGRPGLRKRPDTFDLAIAVLAVILAILLWQMPARTDVQMLATRDNELHHLALVFPPIPNGMIIDWEDPVLAEWLAESSLSRRVVGRLDPAGRKLAVRPWLYSETWLPQPIAAVDDNGWFEATVWFDPHYRAPLVMNLEVEDQSTGQVTASYTYFFKAGVR